MLDCFANPTLPDFFFHFFSVVFFFNQKKEKKQMMSKKEESEVFIYKSQDAYTVRATSCLQSGLGKIPIEFVQF
jgi:hypothetical protein